MGQPSSQRPMTPLEWAMLVVLAAVWGGAFFFNALALGDLPVLTVVVSRLGLGALILYCIMRLRGGRLPADARIWAAFILMGLINNAVPFTMIAWAQTHISSGVASILNASTPLFTVVIAHHFTTDERATAGKLLGVVVGFVGVAVMIGADAFGIAVVAQIASLSAALCYAVCAVFGRRIGRMGVAPVTAATGQLLAASLLLMPFMLAIDRPWSGPVPSATAIGAVVAGATFSTALGYVLYYRILASAGATNLQLVTFLIPVFACLLGILFLGEVLAARHVAGMAAIGMGLAMIDGRPWSGLRRRIVARRQA